MMLTFEFLAKYQSLPDGRPLVLLSLYSRVKKFFLAAPLFDGG